MTKLLNNQFVFFKKCIFSFLFIFILFNSHKFNVYAEQKSFNIDFSSNKLITDTSNKYLLGSYEDNDIKLNFYYKTTNIPYKYYFPIILKDKTNDNYLIFGIASNTSDILNQGIFNNISLGMQKNFDPHKYLISYPPNIFLYNDDTIVCNTATPCSTNNIDLSTTGYNQYNLYSLNVSNSTLSSNYSSNTFSSRFKSGNIEFVGTNIPVTISIGTEILYEFTPSIVPSNFTEIDLTNYQGVYFYPKNYNDIVIETIDNKNYYDFNFYYQGCVNYGYFPLNNPQNVTLLDNSLTCSLDDISYVDSYFPTYVPDELSFDYLYYSYLIYNTNTNASQLGTGVGSISPSLYGNTKIYYNSDLYNYFLVEDFSTMNNKNCFINYDNEEQCIDGVGVPPFNDILDNSQNTSTDSKLDIFKYQGNNYILKFLSLPFNFIKSFYTTSCKPITLPIPFVSSNITIPCLSSHFKNVLGSSAYIFITTIINGFLVYRITLRNIDTFTDVADPENDKLEVIDL